MNSFNVFPKNENKVENFEGNVANSESSLRLKSNLKHELSNTQFADEYDRYQSESNVKCFKNVIYAHLIYIVDYKICFYHQVSDLIIKKKLVRAFFKKSCWCHGKSCSFNRL